MAIVSSGDLFDFAQYQRDLADATANAAAFAAATVGHTTRINTAYAGVLSQISTLSTQIAGLNLAPASATTQLSSMGSALGGLTTQAAQYQAALGRLNAAQSASELSINDLKRLLNGLQQEYRQLIPTQADYAQRQAQIAAQVRAVSTALTAQNTVLRDAVRATNTAQSSYDHLTQQTADLRSQLRSMPGAFDLTTGAINRNNAAAVALQRQINQNSQALHNASASMGQHQVNVGNYGSALRGMGSNALMATGAILGISSAFEAVSQGLSIISSMERIDASLRAVSKDSDDFKNTQEFLINTADKLGLSYDVLAKSYKGLKAATNGTALEGKATEQIFTGMVRAGAALKLSSDEVQGALMAVTQMMSKGKITAEELRGQLGERLPGAMKLMAEAAGISEAKLNKMMQQGELLAVDMLPKLAARLDEVYGKNAQSNAETMAGGWNKLTNEVHLFVAALNDNGAISATGNSITSMISETLKGLRAAVHSSDWITFFAALNPTNLGDKARLQLKVKVEQDATVSEFRGMTPGQRKARMEINDENIERYKKQLDDRKDTVLGGDVNGITNRLRAAEELKTRLRRESIKLELKDRKDAQQAEINAERAAVTKREAEAEKAEKDAKKAKAAREKADREKDAATRKAEAAAERSLRESLTKSESTSGRDLATLNDQHQDGLITEQAYIEQRLQITQTGLNERQAILKRAGKTETDDYQKVITDKIKAEADYKRAQLQLDLKTNKGTTAEKLATLDSAKGSGAVTELAYVEQRHQILTEGIKRDQAILREAGQAETELYRATNTALEKEDADYYTRKLKAEEKSWKEQLTAVREGLTLIDQQLAAEYTEQLTEIEAYYTKKQRAVELDVKRGLITKPQGEAALHTLRLAQLSEELRATENAYQKDRQLSDSLVNDKIKSLTDYQTSAVRTPAEIEAAQQAIRDLEKQRDRDAADDKKKLNKDVADNAKKNSDEEFKHDSDNIDKAKKKREALLQMASQFATTLGDTTFSIVNGNLQRQSDEAEKQYKNELSLAGDNADAKTRIEEEYNRKKAEIARKQAIADREHALFSIAINTATAVASVLSTGGGSYYADFGISAGILTAFVLATGALQAAAVLAAPLPPAYKYGKSASNPYTGPALAGEAGTELFVDRDGFSTLLNKPTVINTRAGDTIYTASETARIAADWQRNEKARQLAQESVWMDSAAARLQSGRRDELKYIYHTTVNAPGSNLTKKDVADAFGQALDSRPERITAIDEDGFHDYLKTGRSRTEYLNNRNRLR